MAVMPEAAVMAKPGKERAGGRAGAGAGPAMPWAGSREVGRKMDLDQKGMTRARLTERGNTTNRLLSFATNKLNRLEEECSRRPFFDT